MGIKVITFTIKITFFLDTLSTKNGNNWPCSSQEDKNVKLLTTAYDGRHMTHKGHLDISGIEKFAVCRGK